MSRRVKGDRVRGARDSSSSVDMFPHGVDLECTSRCHLFRSFTSSSFSLPTPCLSLHSPSISIFCQTSSFLFTGTGNSAVCRVMGACEWVSGAGNSLSGRDEGVEWSGN